MTRWILALAIAGAAVWLPNTATADQASDLDSLPLTQAVYRPGDTNVEVRNVQWGYYGRPSYGYSYYTPRYSYYTPRYSYYYPRSYYYPSYRYSYGYYPRYSYGYYPRYSYGYPYSYSYRYGYRYGPGISFGFRF